MCFSFVNVCMCVLLTKLTKLTKELCEIYPSLPEHVLERSPQYRNSDRATQKELKKKMKQNLGLHKKKREKAPSIYRQE